MRTPPDDPSPTSDSSEDTEVSHGNATSHDDPLDEALINLVPIPEDTEADST